MRGIEKKFLSVPQTNLTKIQSSIDYKIIITFLRMYVYKRTAIIAIYKDTKTLLDTECGVFIE